jgi:hypothetical protein
MAIDSGASVLVPAALARTKTWPADLRPGIENGEPCCQVDSADHGPSGDCDHCAW